MASSSRPGSRKLSTGVCVGVSSGSGSRPKYSTSVCQVQPGRRPCSTSARIFTAGSSGPVETTMTSFIFLLLLSGNGNQGAGRFRPEDPLQVVDALEQLVAGPQQRPADA